MSLLPAQCATPRSYMAENGAIAMSFIPLPWTARAMRKKRPLSPMPTHMCSEVSACPLSPIWHFRCIPTPTMAVLPWSCIRARHSRPNSGSSIWQAKKSIGMPCSSMREVTSSCFTHSFQMAPISWCWKVRRRPCGYGFQCFKSFINNPLHLTNN